jgi:hypothetical protein
VAPKQTPRDLGVVTQQNLMSAFACITDVGLTTPHVRKVPTTEVHIFDTGSRRGSEVALSLYSARRILPACRRKLSQANLNIRMVQTWLALAEVCYLYSGIMRRQKFEGLACTSVLRIDDPMPILNLTVDIRDIRVSHPDYGNADPLGQIASLPQMRRGLPPT